MSDWVDVMKRKAELLAWEAAHPGEQLPVDEDSTDADSDADAAVSRGERASGMRPDPTTEPS